MNTFHLGSCDDYTNSRPSRWDFRHRHYVRPLYAYPVGIRKADFVRQARTSHYTLNTWHPTISQAAFRHCPSYGFVRQAVAVFTILTTDAPIVIATERAILVRPRHRHATNYAIGHESDFMLSHWLREQPYTHSVGYPPTPRGGVCIVGMWLVFGTSAREPSSFQPIGEDR